MVFGEKIGNIPSWILGKKLLIKKCTFEMVTWVEVVSKNKTLQLLILKQSIQMFRYCRYILEGMLNYKVYTFYTK